jgi:ferrous-iron efflux pump FieF
MLHLRTSREEDATTWKREADESRLRHYAAVASLALAILLASLKAGAAIATGSLAVLSSLIDSVADVAASAITFFSVRISQQPPDRRHRFGHGKAESLSALAQSTLVAGSALFVLLDAIGRMLDPAPLRAAGLGIAVMAFASLTTFALVLFQRHVIRRTGSQAIAADSLHYSADLAVNLSVIVSLIAVQHFGWPWLDPLLGLCIAAYLGWHALAIGRNAINVLMDHELPGPSRQRIKDLILAHPEVQGFHDLRTRESGSTVFIELHLELDPEMTVREAHDVTDRLEEELTQAFPDSEIIIHQEPAGLMDPRLDHRIAGDLTAPTA